MEQTTGRAVQAIQEALQAISEIDANRKKLEERLRRERDFAQGIFDAARVVILLLDTDGRIVTANPYFESLTGYGLSEIVGLDWFDSFLPVEYQEEARALFAARLQEPEAESGNINPILTRDGRLVDIEWTAAILRNGAVTGLLSVGVDVSERVRLMKEREALSRRKEQFMANVSHELRTPLTLIRAYVKMMMQSDRDFSDLADLNDAQRKVVSLIEKRSDELFHLVTDILTIQELSDPEALTYVQGAGTVDLADLCRSLCETFGPVARESGLTLECCTDSGPVLVQGSVRMLGRAVNNIMANAIKFTDAGGVSVSVDALDNQAVIAVSDTGIGIPASEQDAIFERFYQANGSATRRHGGSGIGLSVVRDIMEAHGGRVEVESSEGAGSTFYLYFPLW